MLKLIKKGAEGDLYLTKWDDTNAILKSRKKKDYRNSELDSRIRKQRTIREAEVIVELKSLGLRTPLIYHVDIKKCDIIMQYIHGTVVHDLSEASLIKACNEIGKIIGIMHKNGIMHGDMTTSNFISRNGEIFVIDLGLAIRTKKPEDHAVDLRLFKEILSSAHTKIMKKVWSSFLKGYRSSVGGSYYAKISNLVAVIESRGRYATVV